MGIYRATPRREDAGFIASDQRGFKSGGRVLHLPGDTRIVTINGILPDRKTIGIYEVVLFTEGPSPKRK